MTNLIRFGKYKKYLIGYVPLLGFVDSSPSSVPLAPSKLAPDSAVKVAPDSAVKVEPDSAAKLESTVTVDLLPRPNKIFYYF